MKEKGFILLNLLFIVVATAFFHNVHWNATLGGQMQQIICMGVFVAYFVFAKNFPYREVPFSTIVWLLVLIPFLSVVSKVFINGESFYDLRITHLPLFILISFFLFYTFDIKEKSIIKVFVITGIVIFAIQVFQLVLPSKAMFGIIDPNSDIAQSIDDIAEMRNGMYRYRLESQCISLFCMYYYWSQFLERKKFKSFLWFSVFFASMYFYLTRQIMAASIITLAFSFLFEHSTVSQKIKYIAGILFFGIILYALSGTLFGSLIELTQSDVTNEDNIRIYTYSFFWEKIKEDPVLLVLGHGYLNEMTTWANVFSFYASDIGIVGQWFVFGLVWVILYIVVLIQFIRFRKEIPTYIKLYVFATFLCCPMIFPYRSAYEYYVWACIFYISSLHIMYHREHPELNKKPNGNKLHYRPAILQDIVPKGMHRKHSGADLS